MIPADYHPFLLERIRADGLLQLADLFAADPQRAALYLLHQDLVESALQMSEARLTELRLDWWAHTLLSEPERHPLAHSLQQTLAAQRAVLLRLVRVLDGVSEWATPARMDLAWQQALQLAVPLAELLTADPATLAAHAMLARLRTGTQPGPHNPGLCPLDLRARHQVAELGPPASWPRALRTDWAAQLRQNLLVTPRPQHRFERALRGLIERELRRVARERWQARAAGRGLGALWCAWRSAVG